MSPLRFYGVAAYDGHGAVPLLPEDVALVVVRDLAALVRETTKTRPSVSARALETHRAAVDAVFAQRHAILPAPAGVVFRTRGALVRWLELHYVPLRDALDFVEGRAGARVHIRRRGTETIGTASPTQELSVDIDGLAAERFKALRRHAVAAVTLKPGAETGAAARAAASASFLVEQDGWSRFEEMVAEEGRRDPALLVCVTGPWPPYDFVRMQFGG